MAFTGMEKARIRLYLGYANLNRYKNTRLESCLQDGEFDTDTETLVRNQLVILAAVDAFTGPTTITTSAGRGALKRVDETEFYNIITGAGIVNASSLTPVQIGSLALNKLSIIFGVPPFGDYFGTAGYPGDFFTGGIGMPMGNRGGGGRFGLG